MSVHGAIASPTPDVLCSGGGNERNQDLNNAAVPVLWMANEARFAGLRLHPSKVHWSWEELKNSRPKESLNFIWGIFERLPLRRLSYAGVDDATWYGYFVPSFILLVFIEN